MTSSITGGVVNLGCRSELDIWALTSTSFNTHLVCSSISTLCVMPACEGCSAILRTNQGLQSHYQQSQDPRCIAYREVVYGTAISSDEDDVDHAEEDEMDVDVEPPAQFAGDLYGAGYQVDDFPGFEEENPYNPDDEEDYDDEDDFSRNEEDYNVYEMNDRVSSPILHLSDPEPELESDDDIPDASLGGQQAVEDALHRNVHVHSFPSLAAGAPVNRQGQDANTKYGYGISDNQQNPYVPFTNHLNWEIACWAKLRGPGSNALNELLAIEGLPETLGLQFKTTQELNAIIDAHLPSNWPSFSCHPVILDGERFEVFYCDVIECIKALFGNALFDPHLIFVPEFHFTNDSKDSQVYHDMHTARWWWYTQEQLEAKSPGATIIPVIISSDKTQVTLVGGKTAYPVYIAIGNIPKEIRRKPSHHAHILLAYLPTTKLEHISSDAAHRRMVANIIHAAFGHILEPLIQAGKNGILIARGNGDVHHCYPIYAAHPGDYMEHIAVTGCKLMECPICLAKSKDFGNLDDNSPMRDIDKVKRALDVFETNPHHFAEACKEANIKPIPYPFWKNLPWANIYLCIPPDILHQLHQGLIKHLVSWILAAYSEKEIDARCRSLPPNHHVQHFKNGISHLSQITGKEHAEIAKIIIGLIIDLPLPGGQSPIRLIRATWGILDFIYIAQFPVHSKETLECMENALKQFHDNKHIFVELGI
ncbi:hypothetical protein QCA50_016675 [Cerrena zonata]|uniref:Transposase n=1 Tax=Cerrena zonata TaxID=2478898 RepID=A0AAW0FHV3_9APHY